MIEQGLAIETRILAIDIGGGTQDVLVYDSAAPIENAVKLVLPSQTQVVGRKIAQATAANRAVFLSGPLMGGGASVQAMREHLAAGLQVFATHDAARTVHNDLGRAQEKGVTVTDTPLGDVVVIPTGDLDLDGIRAALERFEVVMPEVVALAVQDHGYDPSFGGREFRSEYLRLLLERGGDALAMIFREPPAPMTRMRAVLDQCPGALVMDTGAAAVLGILGDEFVAEHAAGAGAILINVGNLHTFAVAFRGSRIYGLFEHHTGGVTPEWLGELVGQLQAGTLTHAQVKAKGGHGAAFSPEFEAAGPFDFVAVTGPKRAIARPLGFYEATPHGDMMMSGPYGLVRATLALLASERDRTNTPV